MDQADIERMRVEVASGLPGRVRWIPFGVPWTFDFARAHNGLLPATTLQVVGREVDPAWSDLYLFGEESYEGGASPVLCIHRPTGEVRGLDVEREGAPVFFLNSGVAAFVETMRAIDRTLRLRELAPRELGPALHAIDPVGFPRSEWRDFVTELLAVGQDAELD